MTTSAKRVPMIATARQCYDGRWLHSGEPFEAVSEEDAADLEALRFAERVNRLASAPVNPSPEVLAKALSADGTDTGGSIATEDNKTEQERQQEELEKYRSQQRNGQYNRRDMRAKK